MKAKAKKRVARMPEHYDSIDAPVFVWQKVHETQDVTWLLTRRQPAGKRVLSRLLVVWDSIYDQFITEFGYSEQFLSIKRKELHIAGQKLKLILTGDRVLETFIEIEEQELDDMRRGLGKAGFMDSKIAVERHFKFQINMMTTSIREFYSYLKTIK